MMDLWVSWVENGNRRERIWRSPCTLSEAAEIIHEHNWLSSFDWFMLPYRGDYGFINTDVKPDYVYHISHWAELPIYLSGFSLESIRLIRVMQLATGYRKVK